MQKSQLFLKHEDKWHGVYIIITFKHHLQCPLHHDVYAYNTKMEIVNWGTEGICRGGPILADNFLPKPIPLQDAIAKCLIEYSAWDEQK